MYIFLDLAVGVGDAVPLLFEEDDTRLRLDKFNRDTLGFFGCCTSKLCCCCALRSLVVLCDLVGDFAGAGRQISLDGLNIVFDLPNLLLAEMEDLDDLRLDLDLDLDLNLDLDLDLNLDLTLLLFFFFFLRRRVAVAAAALAAASDSATAAASAIAVES